MSEPIVVSHQPNLGLWLGDIRHGASDIFFGAYVQGVSITTSLVLFVVGRLVQVLCGVYGVCYPLYKTSQAIKGCDPNVRLQWLYFWLAYAPLLLLDYFYFIGSRLPFYNEIRLGYILWLLFPNFKGSLVMFEKKIQPWIQKNESKVDAQLEKARENLAKTLKDVKARVLKRVRQRSADILAKGQSMLVDSVGQISPPRVRS